MKKPIRILDNVGIAIHERQLAEHGGTEGIRDRGALESALTRPKNRLAYGDPKPDIAALAAAYAYGVISNHPFVDGNKRTAFTVCRTFLKLNGYDIDATPEEKYRTFLRLAKGETSESGLARWIREHRK